MALQFQPKAYSSRSPTRFSLPQFTARTTTHSPPPPTRRAALSLFTISTFLSGFAAFFDGRSSRFAARSEPRTSDFTELPNSGGVKALDLRIGDGEQIPSDGDKAHVRVMWQLSDKFLAGIFATFAYFGRELYQVLLEKVIFGIESAVSSMKVGGIRRVIIPPSQGYQNTFQEPIPPNIFDRQRLFTTIFNPTRLANGEGSTLGTLIFDIELISVRRP
ncbi:peptidyl-prolyl cis-trans isomerase [Striga asiatica]|uniref:peptidylprolyl isomerase n=1 Tax=Striga asiatica TaxID=4170 RepID=A0A5A7QD88_STRAF|nr:peptidyl-prolyl cis-trans isomerase [Striga asiatica]